MLTDEIIDKAEIKNTQYKLYDLKGLYLLIKPTGSKLWRMKYRFQRKEKSLSFGNYDTIKLSEAREKAKEARRYLLLGKDPSEIKKVKKSMNISTPIKTLRTHLKHLEEMREKLDYKKREIDETLDSISYDLNEISGFIEETRGAIKLLEEYLK